MNKSIRTLLAVLNSRLKVKMNQSKYDIKEVLGRGSFGAVHLAIEKGTGKKFAIKKVDNCDPTTTDPEVGILKKIKHNYIIQYVEAFYSQDGKLCIVMEYADRGTMESDVIGGKANKEEFSVWRVLSQLSDALDYLHKLKPAHVLHRDLKPVNILGLNVWKEQKKNYLIRYKIADFGIAKLLTMNAQGKYYASTLAGTPIYMAPEVTSKLHLSI
jgi:serine/threonine protein kinase